MKLARGASAAAFLLCLLAPAPARAQLGEARVLPRGWAELRAVGVYTQFDTRYLGGGSEPLGGRFESQLRPLVERLLGDEDIPALRTGVASFFEATAGDVDDPVTPDSLSPGTLRTGLAADLRYVPFTLSYGLTRRITVDVTMPIQRRGTGVAPAALFGGTVGLNPAATRNAQLLAEIDAAFGALGSAPFLPTAGSEVGVELQRRVRALTGDTLDLPDRPLTLVELVEAEARPDTLSPEEIAALGITSGRSGYQLGDVSVGARFQLTGPAPGPGDTLAGGVRTVLGVHARLPTGARSNTLFLLQIPPEAGHFGVGADLLAEVPVSRRWRVGAAAGFETLFPTDVRRRAFAADRPFPDDTIGRELRREPGARITASLTPRWLLTREISFAGHYAFEHVGATTYTASDELGEVLVGPIETTEAWTAHRVGLGGAYSTMDAFRRGRTPLPMEVWLLYRTTVAGSGGAARSGSIEVGARFAYQLFGRPRRERADTTATDSAAAPPPPAQTPQTPQVTPPGERPTVPQPTVPARPGQPPQTPPAQGEPQPATGQPTPAQPAPTRPPPPRPEPGVPPPER